MKTTRIISSPDEIIELLTHIRSGRHRFREKLVLQHPKLPEAEAQQLSADLNRNYYSCGCDTATAFGFSAVIGTALILSFGVNGVGELRWSHGLMLLLAFLLGVGVGKAIGKHRARKNLLHILDQLISIEPNAYELTKGDGSTFCAHNPQG